MNTKVKDSSSKLIFGDAILCAQFLRDYIDIPILKNVKPEDIEDVSERYVNMNTEERNADTVKKIKIAAQPEESEKQEIFFITLIEHKTEVDYNVVMQLFRYMVHIWDDFEKEMKKEYGSNVCRRKEFAYPPILPVVYFEGKREWTAVTNFKDRILFHDIFGKYIPDFSYELVNLSKYSNEELVRYNDEISLLMLLNRLQATRKEARAEGKRERLVSQSCKKLAKSKTEEEIAEALEEELSVIHALCKIARKYEPEYDVDRICREFGEWEEENRGL